MAAWRERDAGEGEEQAAVADTWERPSRARRIHRDGSWWVGVVQTWALGCLMGLYL
jgi:hypothetical protein